MMKTIVVSGVSLRKGGTLTILRNCLEYLSELAETGEYRIVALVHNKDLVLFPHIEYIEFPSIINRWDKRLWCEYHTMYKISKQLAPVDLWLSMHDTSPHVEARRKAVYCQTSFPFLHWKLSDLKYDYKIVLFALFTRFAYLINIKQNNYLIVQTQWLRTGFAEMFGLPEEKFIVFPPRSELMNKGVEVHQNLIYTFLYAATPDCHKNFECICQAAEALEKKVGNNQFRVVLTINGKENTYSRWLYAKWGHVDSLYFKGYMSKIDLYDQYAHTDCLIFPSRIETWGLPISEFVPFHKPMLLADLPYAHETSQGADRVAFFNPMKPLELQEQMESLMKGDSSFLRKKNILTLNDPVAYSWQDLFNRLLIKK